MTNGKTRETESDDEKPAMGPLSQIAAYGHQLNELLDSVGAKVEVYKFSIEKQKGELIIDVAVKASFSPKGRTATSQ